MATGGLNTRGGGEREKTMAEQEQETCAARVHHEDDVVGSRVITCVPEERRGVTGHHNFASSLSSPSWLATPCRWLAESGISALWAPNESVLLDKSRA